MKALLLYYSYGGNTRGVAKQLCEVLDCDSAEIATVTPYTGSYDDVVAQGQREIDSGFEPPVQPLAKDPNDYDTVILGTPVWWYSFAPAVKTVLAACDWNGKTVYPFATNGGWIGHTFRDIQSACAGADVRDGLNLRFDGARQQTPPEELDRWAAQIKKEK